MLTMKVCYLRCIILVHIKVTNFLVEMTNFHVTLTEECGDAPLITYLFLLCCHSLQSGLTVEQFHYLSVEYLTFSECSHKPNVSAVVLDTGSELSLNHVTLSKSSSDSEYTGLAVNNVKGSFSIRSSVFYTPMHGYWH